MNKRRVSTLYETAPNNPDLWPHRLSLAKRSCCRTRKGTREPRARVLTWPSVDIGEPDSYEALDETIENLFGYDWLIFRNVNSVNFFLGRFQAVGHEISDLDGVRVCGVGERTVSRLEEMQVHLDVIPEGLSDRSIFEAIENYVGGQDAMRGLNFLVPGAGASSYLRETLEEAGARVDMIETYRTVAAGDSTLVQLNSLLIGGGIDSLVFLNSSEVHEFAQLFDTADLSRHLDATVACASVGATQTATDYLGRADIITVESQPSKIAQAIMANLSG